MWVRRLAIVVMVALLDVARGKQGGGAASSLTDLCDNTCPGHGDISSDGYCDDGGPGSEDSLCQLGTDCNDCAADARGSSRQLRGFVLLPPCSMSFSLSARDFCLAGGPRVYSPPPPPPTIDVTIEPGKAAGAARGAAVLSAATAKKRVESQHQAGFRYGVGARWG